MNTQTATPEVLDAPAGAAPTPTTTPNIGPGAIAQASETGCPAFALSTSDWLAIQVYVNNALALPTTAAALQTSLGPGAPTADFSALVTAYANINSHVTTWQNTTFPASVSLASDIYNYAQQAPTYYNPILPLAQQLTTDPNNQQAKDQLAAILGVLSKSAQDNHDKAAAVAAQIQTFANQTQADKVVLSGVDGKGGLQAQYNAEFGSTSTEVKTLTDELTAQQAILAAANAEYNHDVIVAATTPTYAWVWPFGTIAAGVVAGVYGDKAVKALEKVRAAQQQINTLSDQLAADAKLLIAINTIEAGIGNILQPLNAALPIIQKIQGVWGAITDDLNSIIALISTNIEQVPPIIMNMGVQSAITAWTAVGAEANAYRVNAYITVTQ
jgi:hypothetical protein